ncbi:MAG: hypothetical protein RIT81_35750 [Deltaproteobacteria bacterium]
MSTTRRKVLIGLGAVAAAGGAWALKDELGEDYGLLTSLDAAKALGVAYVAEHGTPDLAVLEALLGDGDPSERLVNQVREDFTAGRIVQIQGWFFSKTEADLCALVARG